MVCCGLCFCCPGGVSFTDLVKSPPTTADVQRFMGALQAKEDPDGEDDTCCWCFPKALFCCVCRCCCPCFCEKPDPVATVNRKEVVEAARASGSDSFLGNEACVKYISKLFVSKSASKVRTEYLSAGLVLLSVGSMQEKLKALFNAFAHAVGGLFNREALERTVRSLMKTCIDIAAKVSDTLSGALVPGGKAVRLMLAALSGTVGGYFIKKRVDDMLKGDKDKDGQISYEEFAAVAMGKKSLVRKTLLWVDQKTKVMRGEREKDLSGRVRIDDQVVWALVRESEVDAEQKIEFWADEAGLVSRNAATRINVVSLQEPCSITDGDDADDNAFVVVDRESKQWKIETDTRDSFFLWYDAIDQYCDAEIDERELEGDKKGWCFGMC